MARKPAELAPIMTRVPERLRSRLEQEAAGNGRSMNSEIIHRLEESFRSQSENLLRVVLDASIRGEPKWIAPEHGPELRWSSALKAQMKQRIGGFIDSLPETKPVQPLSEDEAAELWEDVQAAQKKIDEQKKGRGK